MIDFENGSVIKLRQSDHIGKEIEQLLIAGETIIGSYKGVRDSVVFTNKRVIAINVQGVTGKKKDYTSIPYSKIQTFSIETSGVFDLDSELELWISGVGLVKFEFTGSCDIVNIGQAIASFIL